MGEFRGVESFYIDFPGFVLFFTAKTTKTKKTVKKKRGPYMGLSGKLQRGSSGLPYILKTSNLATTYGVNLNGVSNSQNQRLKVFNTRLLIIQVIEAAFGLKGLYEFAFKDSP